MTRESAEPISGKENPAAAHRRMEACEAAFAKILNSLPLIVWMTDPGFNCQFTNQKTLDISGYAFEELSGQKYLAVLHPEDRGSFLKNVQTFLSTHRPFRQEYRGKCKDGQLIWLREIGAPRFGPEGTFSGHLGTLIEVTDEKIREEQLRKKHRHLEKEILRISEWERNRIGRDLHDTLSQLLLGVSLKAMLLSESLREKELPEFYVAREVCTQIEQILSTTRRLSQFLFPVTLTKNDFLEALHDLSDQVRRLFGCTLVFQWEGDMPDLDPETGVQLYHIVQEAVTNAVRHGGAKRIQVSFKEGTNGRRLLEIRDDGDGGHRPGCGQGLGFHIMEYRARSIGGEIEIGKTSKGRFVLSCHYTNPT